MRISHHHHRVKLFSTAEAVLYFVVALTVLIAVLASLTFFALPVW